MTDLLDVLHRPVPAAAASLLGARLTHGDVSLRVTEVEAYGGSDDPGSHAYRRRTRRNAVMFGPAGRLYCYLSYGRHVCANVVTGGEGEPGAVLLRAGEVVGGIELARSRRPAGRDRDLTRGPARLCRALAIGLDLDGCDLTQGPVTLELAADPGQRSPGDGGPAVSTGPRVGLRGAPDRPWRFWLDGDPTVSAYRPAAAPRRR